MLSNFTCVQLCASIRVFVVVCGQVCVLAAGVWLYSAVFLCVSVCLAGVFLILGVDILEDKGPI